MLKECKRCKVSKPIDAFPKDKSIKSGRRSVCQPCRQPPNVTRNNHLKREYGITLEDEKRLLHKQDYRCLICYRQKDEFKYGLHVDHCHKTKKVRGLLCGPCNQMLGNASDSVERLANAIKYLNEANK